MSGAVYALNLFNVADRDEYLVYSRRSAKEVQAHGGRVIALGKFREAATGDIKPRAVMILVEWASRKAFDDYCNDPKIADLHPHREKGASDYIWHYSTNLKTYDRFSNEIACFTPKSGMCVAKRKCPLKDERLRCKDTRMAKGYWIVSVDISNPESHKMYIAETRTAFRKYGARFVIRGGKSEVVEGKGRSRIVVIEFKDYATALKCYRSPEYAKAIEIRGDSAVADIIIAEGYHGAQPADD